MHATIFELIYAFISKKDRRITCNHLAQMDMGFNNTNDWSLDLPPIFSPLRAYVNTYDLDPLINLVEIDEISVKSTENPSQCEAQHQNPILVLCNNSQEDNTYSLSPRMSMANNSPSNFFEVLDEISVESTESPSQCGTPHQNPIKVPFNRFQEDNNYSLSSMVSMANDYCSISNRSASWGYESSGQILSNISEFYNHSKENDNSSMSGITFVEIISGSDGYNNGGDNNISTIEGNPINQKSGNSRKTRCFKKSIGETGGGSTVGKAPDRVKKQSRPAGGFKCEEEAARARDLAALKCWGLSTPVNFPLKEYKNGIMIMENMTNEEFLKLLRRIMKLESEYKKYKARLGRGRGLKGIYLGLFDIEEVAALAYDIAAIKTKGKNAITNFRLSSYNIEDINERVELPLAEGVWKYLGTVYGISVDSEATPQIQLSSPLQTILALHHQNLNFSLHDNHNPNTALHGLTGTESGLDVNGNSNGGFPSVENSTYGFTGTGGGLDFNGNSNGRFPSDGNLTVNQTDENSKDGFTGTGSGLDFNGNSNGGFPSDENLTVTQTDENSTGGFWEGFEQPLPLENPDQILPPTHNQYIQFGLNENAFNQALDENTSPSPLQEFSGTASELETIGNSSDSSGEVFPSNGMQEENSTFMEVTTNVMEGNQVQPISAETEGWFEIFQLDEDEFSFNSNSEEDLLMTREDEFNLINSNWVEDQLMNREGEFSFNSNWSPVEDLWMTTDPFTSQL
ncbi:hypothetical protein F0562_015695 [Nyssa sinensis]|uniref:AP2/ERF domain-containing protein n=1 Tax=Nyssa sinensis TaxID=561372 RepID=A0A5J4ZMA9_9ASTE|nr:hypothetical protein F0562_015695 [Nyssa sinensis]